MKFNAGSYFQEKYNQLLAQIPELRLMAQRGEDFLHLKHMQGNAPQDNTLLLEMVRAKRGSRLNSLTVHCSG